MVVRGVVIMLDTILLLNWQFFTDWIRKRLALGHYCTIAGVRYLRVIF